MCWKALRPTKAFKPGETNRVISLVDKQIIPHVFVRMTASAVGRNWHENTPEQQNDCTRKRFKILLIRIMVPCHKSRTRPLTSETLARHGDTRLVRSEVLQDGVIGATRLLRWKKLPRAGRFARQNVLGVWLVGYIAPLGKSA
jgi:phospholipid transport system substrate-binding protein